MGECLYQKVKVPLWRRESLKPEDAGLKCNKKELDKCKEELDIKKALSAFSNGADKIPIH
jgi:hypothetical protein